ncbi:MAG: hypothetical protein EA378_03540 [Phycisphaerales bacterium]|nr:MAG: hypothetical protein EA378_03540 [Phycisphaerales bacterium]
MIRTSKLVTVAGVAACFAGAAVAQNADQNRAYTMDLMADADSRTSLLQAGGSSGYNADRGFFFGSTDGNNTLNIRALQQFRYYLNFGDNDRFGGIDNADFANGFENQLTRFTFHGNVINQDLSYKIQFAFDNAGDISLQDAWGMYRFDNDFYVGWGQFRAPVLAEEFRVDDQYQLAAGRGFVNNFFAPGYTQGIFGGFRGEDFGVKVALTDGAGAANSPYVDFVDFGDGLEPGNSADFAITVRGDWKFAGQWDQFNEFTSFQGSETGGVVGGAVHYQSGGNTLGTADVDAFIYTVDFAYKGDGWNAFAAFVGRNVDPEGGSSFDDFGIVAQGGIFVTDQIELFGRWDLLLLDDDIYEEDTLNFLTVGANYYFIAGSHAAKFTGDVVIGINKNYDGLVSADSGLLGNGDNTGEVGVRLQMQLAF